VKKLAALYLVVVAVTLWLTGEFGPWMSVADSLVGIGLIIAIWYRLQEDAAGENFNGWMMLLLTAGAGLVLLVNLDRSHIAAASAIAFLVASTASAAVFEA
jgi:hypothetical protein